MIAAVPAAAPPRAATPPVAKEISVAVRVDETITGKPAKLEQARASAITRFALDAPAGAELRVRMPEGVGFNAWAWANKGGTGVSFARQGADWVATAKEPLHQISLETNAYQHRGDAIRVDGSTLQVDDLAPTLAVDGVAQDTTARPAVTVSAPLGWQTAAADGRVDAQRVLERVNDIVVADRPAERGAATQASFTGQAPDGSKTTGAARAVKEAAERAGDAAVSAAYVAMMLAGRAG